MLLIFPPEAGVSTSHWLKLPQCPWFTRTWRLPELARRETLACREPHPRCLKSDGQRGCGGELHEHEHAPQSPLLQNLDQASPPSVRETLFSLSSSVGPSFTLPSSSRVQMKQIPFTYHNGYLWLIQSWQQSMLAFLCFSHLLSGLILQKIL